MSIEKIKAEHKITKAFLDSITGKPINPRIGNVIEKIKELEFIERIKAYPEENEIPLTYDELRELAESLKGWETAEEQSNIYSKSKK